MTIALLAALHINMWSYFKNLAVQIKVKRQLTRNTTGS